MISFKSVVSWRFIPFIDKFQDEKFRQKILTQSKIQVFLETFLPKNKHLHVSLSSFLTLCFLNFINVSHKLYLSIRVLYFIWIKQILDSLCVYQQSLKKILRDVIRKLILNWLERWSYVIFISLQKRDIKITFFCPTLLKIDPKTAKFT